MKNKSHRYDINRPKNGRIYTKYKMCLIIMMFTGIKQHLSNIWSSIHENLSKTDTELKKSVAYKKGVYSPRLSWGFMKFFRNFS